MTPQERQLVAELFDRLASLENAPRDPEAVAAINEGLKRAPNALYPLVQTTLVQDEALKRADARIRELEEELGIDKEQPQRQGGFLENMRSMLSGGRPSQGSVPSVRSADEHRASVWGPRTEQAAAYPPAQDQYPGGASASGGGSFLGTAAATAAGVVGGAMLMNSLRGLFGGHGQAHAFGSNPSGSPWSSADGGNLARDAGVGDIGRGGDGRDDGSQRAGLFDTATNDDADSGDADDDFDDDADFSDGGDDSN
jgi:hypothetical protein